MSAEYEPRKAWRIAFLLFLFMGVNFVDKIVVGLLAVPMMEDLKLSPAQFGLIGSSFFWMFAISGVIGGFIANRTATSRMLLIMAVTWSLCQLPMALSSSIAVLTLGRVLLGICEGPAFPVAVHACYKWFPDQKRNLPVAFLSQGAAVGMLVAGVCIPLISARWGWHANFYVLGCVGVIWAVLWHCFGAEGRVGQTPRVPSEAADEHKVAYRKLLVDPTVLGCFLLHFVAYWGLSLVLTWLPAYLQRGLHFDNVSAGRVFAVVTALAIPLTIGASGLAQRLIARGVSSRNGRGRMAGLLLIIAGALLVSLLVSDAAAIWRIAAIAVALGLSPAIYSLGPAILAEVVPASQRGAVLAIDNSIASIAGILGPVVTGYLIQGATGAHGYDLAFALGGALMIGGGAIGACVVNPEKSSRAVRGSVTNRVATSACRSRSAAN